MLRFPGMRLLRRQPEAGRQFTSGGWGVYFGRVAVLLRAGGSGAERRVAFGRQKGGK